jgi:hypothetical protein
VYLLVLLLRMVLLPELLQVAQLLLLVPLTVVLAAVVVQLGPHHRLPCQELLLQGPEQARPAHNNMQSRAKDNTHPHLDQTPAYQYVLCNNLRRKGYLECLGAQACL